MGNTIQTHDGDIMKASPTRKKTSLIIALAIVAVVVLAFCIVGLILIFRQNSKSTPVCGNNVLETGEECDDGNTKSNDGCSKTCKEEASSPVCGNSILETSEDCDDGNTEDGDDCSSECENIAITEGVCGDGTIDDGEDCDDGNLQSNDGCSPVCKDETVETSCGDGIINSGEYCDDGNKTSGDGCSSTCHEENVPPVQSGEYPFSLPADAPFTLEEIQPLYEKAIAKYSVTYKEDSGVSTEEEFAEYIDPYLKLFMASLEYSYDKYADVFSGESPDVEGRDMLSVRAIEKCTDIGSGLTEETCKDVKIMGSISSMMYATSFYVNVNHPDFAPDLIVDVGTHEMIHLLQYTYTSGLTGNLMPAWFKESMAVGLAYYAETKESLYLKDFNQYGAPQSLQDMEEWFRYPSDDLVKLGKKRSAYYVSKPWFDYILTKTTLDEYLTLLPICSTYLSWRDDSEFDVEFKNLTGKLPEDLYQEFLNSKSW